MIAVIYYETGGKLYADLQSNVVFCNASQTGTATKTSGCYIYSHHDHTKQLIVTTTSLLLLHHHPPRSRTSWRWPSSDKGTIHDGLTLLFFFFLFLFDQAIHLICHRLSC